MNYLRLIGNPEIFVAPTGVYDDNTLLSVKDFQAKNRLAETGKVDKETFDLMFSQFYIQNERDNVKRTLFSFITFPLLPGLMSDGMIHINKMMSDLLDYYGINVASKKCVVLGRSNIVGKPMAHLLLERNGTVTVCHSRTNDLESEISSADVLVVAIGKPQFVKGSMIKPGAVVIDVGINRTPDGKLVGDVDFESAFDVASYITPVPGGVGPMTITTLLKNTLCAAKLQYVNKNHK